MQVLKQPKEGRYPDLFARKPDALRAALDRLAELVHVYGTRALHGDRELFLQLSDHRVKETKRATAAPEGW